MSEPLWAIRDIKHGKTKTFNSLEEMLQWIMKFVQIKLTVNK